MNWKSGGVLMIMLIKLAYSNTFVVVVAVFSIVTALISDKAGDSYRWIILVVPPAILAAFSYLSYQFRVVAMLRGHLAALEEEMNIKIKENFHLWNSTLTEMYMAKNNLINRWMMVPMIFLVLIMTAICFYMTWNAFSGTDIGVFLLIVYWILILLFSILIFIPFLQNERIRHETYKTRTIVAKFNAYKRNKPELFYDKEVNSSNE